MKVDQLQISDKFGQSNVITFQIQSGGGRATRYRTGCERNMVYYQSMRKLQSFIPIVSNNQNNNTTMLKYNLIKCLGFGSFSQVFLCKEKQSGKMVAVKRISKALSDET
jgi:serine/threonine protein kinase